MNFLLKKVVDVLGNVMIDECFFFCYRNLVWVTVGLEING